MWENLVAVGVSVAILSAFQHLVFGKKGLVARLKAKRDKKSEISK